MSTTTPFLELPQGKITIEKGKKSWVGIFSEKKNTAPESTTFLLLLFLSLPFCTHCEVVVSGPKMGSLSVGTRAIESYGFSFLFRVRGVKGRENVGSEWKERPNETVKHF